jgi:3-deoxy-D-manno-octulosonic-acid transferase
LKFDIRLSAPAKIVQDLRSAIPQNSPVIVCGSTAEGEEGLVLEAFKQVQRQFPAAVMILAPRHPERFDKVTNLIASLDIAFLRRSSWTAACPVSGGVFLLDSVGELASVYALADIAFVGGSLVPVGGHNILEPAQYGAAIIVGPHTFNFREIVSIFQSGNALRVAGAEQLPRALLELLSNPEERKRLGRRARELFTQYAGATQRTVQALRPLLGKSGAEKP